MSKVAREIFGHLPDGAAIELIKLFGDNGFEARLITFGAALQSIFVPDRSGRLADDQPEFAARLEDPSSGRAL